jgi:hypothetical protein
MEGVSGISRRGCRGSPRACMTSQPWMNIVRCVSYHLRITNTWIGEGGRSFPEATEELEGAGAAEGGARISVSFSCSVTDIGILAELIAWLSRLIPTSAFWIAAGINKSAHFNQINCGWIR